MLRNKLFQPEGLTPLDPTNPLWAYQVDVDAYMERQWQSCFYVQEILKSAPSEVREHLTCIHEHQKRLIQCFSETKYTQKETARSFYWEALKELLFVGKTPESPSDYLLALGLM